MDCLFCEILKGNIPSYKIYEDDLVYAFLDINPISCGHTLIIPKKHYKDLDDISMNDLTHILNIAKKIKLKLEEKLNCDGVRLEQNNGNIQEVKHFHLHLIPSYTNNISKPIEEVYELLK